jgi:hypothetical protein
VLDAFVSYARKDRPRVRRLEGCSGREEPLRPSSDHIGRILVNLDPTATLDRRNHRLGNRVHRREG